MRKKGVAKGESVYMMIPSLPETWFASFATVKGGFVSVPTATTMTPKELEYRFGTFQPQAILADQISAPIIDEGLKAAGTTPKVKIIVGGQRDGWTNYSEVDKEDTSAEGAKTKSNDLILCFFTSGTTGMAKRVAHTASSYPIGHMSTANIMGIRPGDIHNNLSAPGWAKWAWSSFFGPFNVGATVTGFHFTKLDVDKYLGGVAKFKVNTFCAPPTAWRAFILADLGKYDFSSLRESVSAGEPLNPEIISTWQKYTKSEIRDFYGQTESTAMIGNPPWTKGKIVPGSFGRPSFLYDVAIVSDEGKEVTEANEVGHIAVRLDRWRAKGLFGEYIGNPEKIADVFRGDYYYTGDRGVIDEKGNWWFVGRTDDVIKSSDYRIGPFEVESALVEHPAVAEAAVVGSPDPRRWQLVKGFVILKPNYQPSRELAMDVFKHCTNVLAMFKIPRILEFVPDVPKTLSGKIRRIDLRQREVDNKKKGERGTQEYFFHEFPELKPVKTR